MLKVDTKIRQRWKILGDHELIERAAHTAAPAALVEQTEHSHQGHPSGWEKKRTAFPWLAPRPPVERQHPKTPEEKTAGDFRGSS
jgi:hypothetical protein